MSTTGIVGGQQVGSGVVTASAFRPTAGTALVAGDFALDANWGSGAAVQVTAGSTDQHWRISITAAGTPGANPICTLTFRNGPWPTGTKAIIARNGGTGGTLTPFWSGQPSTTSLALTAVGTPVAGLTYAFDCIML